MSLSSKRTHIDKHFSISSPSKRDLSSLSPANRPQSSSQTFAQRVSRLSRAALVRYRERHRTQAIEQQTQPTEQEQQWWDIQQAARRLEEASNTYNGLDEQSNHQDQIDAKSERLERMIALDRTFGKVTQDDYVPKTLNSLYRATQRDPHQKAMQQATIASRIRSILSHDFPVEGSVIDQETQDGVDAFIREQQEARTNATTIITAATDRS
jgi:hypothetical protein